jgi:hypothetical protein
MHAAEGIQELAERRRVDPDGAAVLEDLPEAAELLVARHAT